MGDDVFQEGMASSRAKQVRRRDEHASRCDAVTIIGHKEMDARLCKRLLPNKLGMLLRLGDGAYLGNCEKRNKRRQIRSASEALITFARASG